MDSTPIYNTDNLSKFKCNTCKSKGFIDIIENGQYVRKTCPECKGKKQALIESDDFVFQTTDDNELRRPLLLKYYNIPACYTGLWSFDATKMFEPDAKTLFDEDSLQKFLDELQNIYDSISSGNLPKTSKVFVFTSHGEPIDFICSCILQAYANNIVVAPFISDLDLRNILSGENDKLQDDEPYSLREKTIKYNDLVEADLCFIYKGASDSKHDLYNIKQLMEHRAMKGRATIICSTYVGTNLRMLYTLNDDENNFSTASRLIFAEYHCIRYKNLKNQTVQEYLEPVYKDGTIAPRKANKILLHNNNDNNKQVSCTKKGEQDG